MTRTARTARIAALAVFVGSAAACESPTFMATGRFAQNVGERCVYCGGAGVREIPPFLTTRTTTQMLVQQHGETSR